MKLSRQLLETIDEAARRNLATRSDFIRESVVMRLNNQQLAAKPRLEDTLEALRRVGRH